ncbi:MAG: hypothetical protein K6E98_09840 [Lachnospiraceae bacterium]|nr:hypothetical protein [Lachnospiraceae bacterium]
MVQFIKKILLFLMLFFATFVLVLLVDYFFVGNQHLGNYQASLLDKIERFRSLEGSRIILIGNSNLPFGMNSEMLEKEMGMPVVNMGLHGGLGSAFNSNMVKLSELREGDIVILSLHTYDDNDEIEDPSLALITIEKHKELWKLVRFKDLYGIAKAYPDYFKDCIMYKFTKYDDNIPEETTSYSRSAFNKYGDIERRFENTFQFYPGSVGIPGVGDVCMERINELNKYVKERGAVLLIAGYPIGYGEYTPPLSEFEAFEKELVEKSECEVISHFTDYLIPYEFFYDTKYHLNAQGADMRTMQLIKDLKKWKEHNM